MSLEPRSSIARVLGFAGCLLLFIWLTEGGLKMTYTFGSRPWRESFALFCVGAALTFLTGTSSAERSTHSLLRFTIGCGVVVMIAATLWRWHLHAVF